MAIYTDSATVPVAIAPSGVEAHTHFDAATVYIDIVPSGVDKFYKPDFTGEGQAFNQYSVLPFDELSLLLNQVDDNPRFEAKLRFGGLDA